MKITLIRGRTEWIVVRHSPSCPPPRSRPLSCHLHSVFITSGDGEFSPYHLSWCVFLRILFSEVCSFFWSWEQYFPRSFTMTWMTGPLIPSYLPARKFMIHHFSPWAVQIHCSIFFRQRVFLTTTFKFWFFVPLYVTCSFVLDAQKIFVFL